MRKILTLTLTMLLAVGWLGAQELFMKDYDQYKAKQEAETKKEFRSQHKTQKLKKNQEEFKGSSILENSFSYYRIRTNKAVIFEDGFETFPGVWTLDPGTGDDWVQGDGTTYGPGAVIEGTNAAYFDDYNYTSGTSASMETEVDLSTATAPKLEFFYWDGGDTDVVEVAVSTNGTDYTTEFTTAEAVDPWAKQTVDLIGYAGEASVFIKFIGTSVYGYTNPHIDDVVVFEPPPYEFALTVPAGVGVTVGESYDYTVTIENTGTSGDDFTPAIDGVGTWTYELYEADGTTAITTPVTIASGDTYDFVVKVTVPATGLAFGDTDTESFTVTSAETGKAAEAFDITTAAIAPVAVPFTESFDDVTAPAMPLGWALETNVNPWTVVSEASMTPNSAPNAIYNFYDAVNDKNDWVFTPKVTLEVGKTYALSFFIQGEGWAGTPEMLEVMIGSEQTSADMTDVLIDIPDEIFVEWTKKDAFFTVDAAGDYVFGFHAYSQADLDYIGIDDVSIMEVSPADAELTELLAPAESFFTGTEDVIATLKNAGSEELTSADINWDINGTTGTFEWTGTLAVGESIPVTVVPAFDFSIAGEYNIELEVVATGDTNPDNNVVSQIVTAYEATYNHNAYADVTATEQFGSVNLFTGEITDIAPTTIDPFPMSATFVDGLMVKIYSNMDMYYKVEEGVEIPMGTVTGVTGTPTGIAYDEVNSIMYAVVLDADNAPQLCTINENLEATVVGTGSGMVISMDLANDGFLYGPTLDDNLVKIDPADGSTEVVGPLGIDINYGQDVSYDKKNNLLYTYTTGAVAKFGTYDLATGAFVEISEGPGQVGTLAILEGLDFYNIDFAVTDDATDPIEGALVEIIDQDDAVILSESTDVDGLVAFTMPAGTYTYKVSKLAYTTLEDVLVADADKSIDVELQTAPPTFSVTPEEKVFDMVFVGNQSDPQTFTVSNIGTGVVTINGVSLDNDTDFMLNDANDYTDGIELATGEELTFDIVFAPASHAILTGTVTVSYNDGTDQTFDVGLSGEGYDPTITVFPWFESFEGAEFPAIGWTNTTWGLSTWGDPLTGEEFAYSNLAGSELTTPPIHVPATDTYQFSFWTRSESAGNPQDMDVLLSTNGVDFDVVVAEIRELATTEYQKYSLDLSDYADQTIYVKFVGLSGDGGWAYGILVDDVMVAQAYPLLLSANPEIAGEVTGNGVYLENESVTINALPNEGYLFVDWQDDGGVQISENAEYTFDMPANGLDYTANFREVVSATIDPAMGTTELANPMDLTTVITWNDATAVTEVIAHFPPGDEVLTEDANGYTIVDNGDGTANLTFHFSQIFGDGTKGEIDMPFTINYDLGDASTYMLTLDLGDLFVAEFVVTDLLTEAPVEGATIEVYDDTETLVDPADDGIYLVPAGTYTYTVNMTNYQEYTGTFEIVDAHVEVAVALDPVRADLTLTVNMLAWTQTGVFDPENDFVDVAGSFNEWGDVAVVLDPIADDPDMGYTATIADLAVGVTHEFKFRINGSWDDATAEFPYGGAARELTIVDGENVHEFWYNDDEPVMYSVTLTVVDADGAIEGATVTFDGVDYTTDVDGIVTIADLYDGMYDYTITMDGYDDATGQIEVAGDDVAETITLVLTGIDTGILSTMKVYPNPFSNQITISNADMVNRVVISNLIGQRVMEISLNGQETINTSDLSSGVYLVTFEGSNGEREVRKMIKQ